jgi:hypothetical protein
MNVSDPLHTNPTRQRGAPAIAHANPPQIPRWRVLMLREFVLAPDGDAGG